MSRAFPRFVGVACAAIILAGCAARKPATTPPQAPTERPQPVACTPSVGADALQGAWYSVSTPRGVGGTMQTLLVISQGGKMRYETQLKIRNRTRPALQETGCWTFADGIYTMRTTESNGEAVDASDPIYTNRYRVRSVNKTLLVLQDLKPGGQVLKARKVPSGYRLK